MSEPSFIPFARSILSRALALAIAPMAIASHVVAEEAEDEETLEYVLVVGQTAQIERALAEQRRSDAIKSVVSSDAVAQLPDENIAEAVQRLPGVSIERDQGEGRFVSVRGLGPDLNSVHINGALIPAPNSDTRAVALDVVPSELVETLSVVKAVTPDMDANSLGGSIDVESLTAFDHDGRFYTVSGESSYDDNTEQTSPKLSGAYSDVFSVGGGEENLGIALAVSWQERDFGSDNVETGGAWDFEEGARLEELEMRDYDITRERSGLGLNIDYKVGENSNLYLRTLYSEFTDTETRNAAGIEFEDPLSTNELGSGEGWREVKDREETQEIQSYVFGGDLVRDQWTFAGQVGYSKSLEDTPAHIAGALFEGVNSFNDVSYSSTRTPVLSAYGDYFTPSAFALSEVEWTEQYTTDEQVSAKFDISRDYQLQGYESTVKFGGKYTQREKDNDVESWAYEDFEDYGVSSDQLLMSNYSGSPIDYSLGRFGPSLNSGGIKQLLAGLDADEFYDDEESSIGDFTMDEDIAALYLMNTVDIDRWRIIAGLRYEDTEFSAEGTGVRDGEYESVTADNSYDHLLPGLHVRYHWDDDTQMRFAWTNTVVRPSFEQLAPGYVIDGEEASFGNPELDPLESSNIDLGIEHYFGRAGLLSAYVFYKDIENFVYESDIAGQGIWADFDEAESYTNGDSADLIGVELAWSQRLDALAAPWNNLLLGANLTWSQSDASIDTEEGSRDIDLPYQSEKVGNFTFGWEDEKLSLRLSVNYKSEYLQEVAALDGADWDLYADEQTFVDFTARYYLTDQLQLSFEAQNLTDESYYVYTGSDVYNAQYEEYGPSFKFSVTFTSM